MAVEIKQYHGPSMLTPSAPATVARSSHSSKVQTKLTAAIDSPYNLPYATDGVLRDPENLRDVPLHHTPPATAPPLPPKSVPATPAARLSKLYAPVPGKIRHDLEQPGFVEMGRRLKRSVKLGLLCVVCLVVAAWSWSRPSKPQAPEPQVAKAVTWSECAHTPGWFKVQPLSEPASAVVALRAHMHEHGLTKTDYVCVSLADFLPVAPGTANASVWEDHLRTFGHGLIAECTGGQCRYFYDLEAHKVYGKDLGSGVTMRTHYCEKQQLCGHLAGFKEHLIASYSEWVPAKNDSVTHAYDMITDPYRSVCFQGYHRVLNDCECPCRDGRHDEL